MKRKKNDEEAEGGFKNDAIDLTVEHHAAISKSIGEFVANHKMEVKLKLLTQKAQALMRLAPVVQHINPDEFKQCEEEFLFTARQLAFMRDERVFGPSEPQSRPTSSPSVVQCVASPMMRTTTANAQPKALIDSCEDDEWLDDDGVIDE
jgi:hypothetical protein